MTPTPPHMRPSRDLDVDDPVDPKRVSDHSEGSVSQTLEQLQITRKAPSQSARRLGAFPTRESRLLGHPPAVSCYRSARCVDTVRTGLHLPDRLPDTAAVTRGFLSPTGIEPVSSNAANLKELVRPSNQFPPLSYPGPVCARQGLLSVHSGLLFIPFSHSCRCRSLRSFVQGSPTVRRWVVVVSRQGPGQQAARMVPPGKESPTSSFRCQGVSSATGTAHRTPYLSRANQRQRITALSVPGSMVRGRLVRRPVFTCQQGKCITTLGIMQIEIRISFSDADWHSSESCRPGASRGPVIGLSSSTSGV